MKSLYRQSGALLVPALIVVIIIVLILMWQAGLFSGGATSAVPQSDSGSSAQSATQTQTLTQSENALNTTAETTAETKRANVPDRELTPGERAAKRVAEFNAQNGDTPPPAEFKLSKPSVATTETGQGAKAAAIDQAAALLLTNHAPDFSGCRSITDREKALECAAGVQTQALNAAFEEHNRLRSAGDEISVQRGGEIMQRVIEGMQRALTPFVDSASGS